MGIFENTLGFGSIIGVLLLAYSQNVAIEVLRKQMMDPQRVMTAGLLHSGLASFFAYAALPCIVWPALYIGWFDGILAGVLAWGCLQVLGALATMALGIRGALTAIHLMIGLIALPIGYYLTLTNAPWS